MKDRLRLLLFLWIAFACADAQQISPPGAAPQWYRGNLHTHTLNSDGDAPPDEVVRWYKANGYHFVVITDHNQVTPVALLADVLGEAGKFLVMAGEEVTSTFDGKAVHVNALAPAKTIPAQKGGSVAETAQRNIDAVRAAGGVPLVNHPNFTWAMTADDLFQLKSVKLFELHSGHPLVNLYGGGGSPSVEAIWDDLLTRGKVIYGAAVDDSHDFIKVRPDYGAKPGQAWVMVQAAKLEPAAILEALEAGRFYSSSGVELADYSVTEKEIRILARERRGRKYTIQFVGEGGKVLREVPGSSGTYSFRGHEKYVRVKVLDSNGKAAWTQPVFQKEIGRGGGI